MTSKKSQQLIDLKIAKNTLVIGGVLLLAVPIVYFAFNFIGTSNCPPDTYSKCDSFYALKVWFNSLWFSALWAVASIITIIVGFVRLYNTRTVKPKK